MNTVRYYNAELNKVHYADKGAAKALKAIGFEIQDEPKPNKAILPLAESDGIEIPANLIDTTVILAPSQSEQVSDLVHEVAECSDEKKPTTKKNTKKNAVNS